MTFSMGSRRKLFATALGLTSLAAGVSHAATPAPSVATTLYSVTAGPAYSTSRTLATTHRLDCSASNPYWDNDACALNLHVPSTAGCLWESQSTENGAAPKKTGCSVSINGPIRWRIAAAYCQLYGDPLSLQVSFTPGEQPGRSVAPIIFQATASLVPTQFSSTRLSTRSYQLTVKAAGAPASANLVGSIAVGNIKEIFAIDFAVPVSDACPNADDNTLSIGNVRDVRSDVTPQNSATAGFINATVTTPI